MSQMKFTLNCYDALEQVNGVLCPTIEKIQDVTFEYDGGRVTIYVNGKVLYHTESAGNDLRVDLEMLES